jgi:hypothetical protein
VLFRSIGSDYENEQVISLALNRISKVEQISENKLEQVQVSKNRLQVSENKLEQVQEPITELKVFPKIHPSFIEPPMETPVITPLRKLVTKAKKKKTTELFVRKKGKFKKVADYESPEQAVLMGKSLIEGSSKASFKVVGLEGMNPIGKFLSSKSFYKSSKEENVFIQRREKRISSLGEKREITFRGLAKLRSQRINGGKSIWA